MPQFQSTLTAQQMEDALVKSQNTTSSSKEIDKVVQYVGDNLAPTIVTKFESANQNYISLNEVLTLDSVGDYVEFEVFMTDMASAYQGTLGIVGIKNVVSNNVIGFLSATDFRMRGDDNTWLNFGNPGVAGNAWNKYKVIVSASGTDYELWVNDAFVNTVTMSNPIKIDCIGAAYGVEFTSMEMKAFTIKSGNTVISTDEPTTDGRFTNHGAVKLVSSPVNFDKNSTLEVVFDGNSNFFVKHQQSDESTIDYDIKHFLNTDNTTTGGQSNGDSWTIYRVFHSGIEGTYTQFVNAGNWESAIKIQGADDFMGGSAHGDEVHSTFSVLADGVKVDILTAQTIRCSQLEMIQVSELTAPPSSAHAGQVVADTIKRWVFKEKGDHKFYHKVTWKTIETLTDTYMFMVPIKRKLNGSTGAQITDSAIRGPLYEEIDVTENTHPQEFLRQDAFDGQVRIWSNVSGYSVGVKILKGWDKPDREFFVSKSDSYNKLYFDYTGSGYVTAVDEVFETEVEFNLNYNKGAE